MSDERRFCRDCRHAFMSVEKGTVKAVLHCFSELNRDLVTGDIEPVDCRIMRVPMGPCSVNGLAWESKQ